jgi:hypothetical protein
VLASDSNVSNICQRAYSLTVDATPIQLPTRGKDGLALNGRISMITIAIPDVFTCCMDEN